MEAMMMDLNTAMDIVNSINDRMVKLGKVGFQSMLGLMIDTWTTMNGSDSVELVDELAAVVKQVNEQEGKFLM